MFNNKRIDELEEKIDRLDREYQAKIEYINRGLARFVKNSKENYMWELREEEIDLIKDGKNMKAIRKILT